MENANQAIRTETKYKVTSCYFCNEFLDNNDFKAHLDKCGQALQKCPNNCLSYIQRKFMEQHLLECPKKSNGDLEVCPSSSEQDGNFFVLEQNINLLRSALHEEIRQRHRLIADIGALRKTSIEQTNQRSVDVQKYQSEIDSLSHQYNEVKEWRKELKVLLDRFYQDLEFRNDATLSFEVLYTEMDRASAKIKSLQSEIESLKTEPSKSPSAVSPINDSSLNSENESVRSPVLSPVALNRCQRCTFLEWKVSESLVELRQIKNIACESEDKCEKLSKTVRDVKKMCAQTRQELVDLQTHLTAEKRIMSTINNEGHLIWRIDQFSAKLKDCKENDITLMSPIFSNKQYGYNLRLHVLLNGLGTWKGRNMLACLMVIPGEWDPLLTWPCKLNADIILLKQTNDSSLKNISKTILVKKQDATYDHNQYIFISHRAVQNQNYLKDDCVFFEVYVHDT